MTVDAREIMRRQPFAGPEDFLRFLFGAEAGAAATYHVGHLAADCGPAEAGGSVLSQEARLARGYRLAARLAGAAGLARLVQARLGEGVHAYRAVRTARAAGFVETARLLRAWREGLAREIEPQAIGTAPAGRREAGRWETGR